MGDGTGQFQAVGDFAGNVYYSSNYGVDWANNSLPYSGYISSLAISSNAKYTLLTTYNAGSSLYTFDTTRITTISASNVQTNGAQISLSLANIGSKNVQIYATNMAGSSPWSRPG